MGYTTEFEGRFEFNTNLDPEFINYINDFAEHRHITRDVDAYKASHPDWQNHCFEGNPGTDGEYIADIAPYTKNDFYFPKNYNTPPGSCPGLYCQWIIEDTGEKQYLKWNEAEKFYKYEEWLRYLIRNFFAPKEYILNGAVTYQGEDEDDYGILLIDNNVVMNYPQATPESMNIKIDRG